MDKKPSRILTIILILLFPIGIVYCIGKNLFSGNLATFIGGILLVAVGFVLAIVFLRPDIVETVIGFFQNLIG